MAKDSKGYTIVTLSNFERISKVLVLSWRKEYPLAGYSFLLSVFFFYFHTHFGPYFFLKKVRR